MGRVAFGCVAGIALGLAATVQAQPPAPTIMPDDQILITVEGHPELTGLYPVDANGWLPVPLVGPVEARGLTASGLTGALVEGLGEYLAGPVVQVDVRRPQRVFVFGDVARPGLYDLTDGMTVLELLLQADYSGVSQVLVARTGNVRAPVLPEQAEPSDVIQVNLRQLESDVRAGDLSRNLLLETGDTVFVPTLDPNNVFVSGEVNNPGAFSVPDGTTVLQALTLAGWVSEQGSAGRTRIVRFVDDERIERRVRLDELVEPGDTLVVPEPYFNPSFSAARGAPALSVGDIRLGRALTVTPVLPLTEVGVDSNVFNETGERQSDVVVQLTPEVGVNADLRRLRMDGYLSAGLVYYRRFESERAVNPGYGITMALDLARRVTLTGRHDFLSSRDRFSFELDPRVRREVRTSYAGVELGPWGRVGFRVSAEAADTGLPDSVIFAGQDLQRTLEERARRATAAVEVELSPATSVSLSLSAASHRFPSFEERDADSGEFRVEAILGRGSFIQGRAHIGFLRYDLFEVTAPDYSGPTFGGELWHTWRERTEVGVRGTRGTSSSFQNTVSFAVIDRYGGWVRQALTNRFDVVVQADQDTYTYRNFGFEATGQSAPDNLRGIRASAQFGVLLRDSRVALQSTYEERQGGFAYNGWRWGIVYSYGVFRAGARVQQ